MEVGFIDTRKGMSKDADFSHPGELLEERAMLLNQASSGLDGL